MTTVDFWFDPLCPWAWISSRWLLDVVSVRPVAARFHVMSLAVLNEDDEIPPEYAAMMAAAWGPVRVLIAAEREHGNEVLGPLYTAMGHRMHLEGRGNAPEIVAEALAEVGLPADLAAAATSSENDQALRVSHAAGMSLVGSDVGTPIIAFDGHAIFGPIVSPAPKGEAAGLLWDGVKAVVSMPGFFELKRTREGVPDLA
jgi:protein-disulfide isomerase-like protein with CxxC motif